MSVKAHSTPLEFGPKSTAAIEAARSGDFVGKGKIADLFAELNAEQAAMNPRPTQSV